VARAPRPPRPHKGSDISLQPGRSSLSDRKSRDALTNCWGRCQMSQVGDWTAREAPSICAHMVEILARAPTHGNRYLQTNWAPTRNMCGHEFGGRLLFWLSGTPFWTLFLVPKLVEVLCLLMAIGLAVFTSRRHSIEGLERVLCKVTSRSSRSFNILPSCRAKFGVFDKYTP
jgi:hypothetical protein